MTLYRPEGDWWAVFRVQAYKGDCYNRPETSWPPFIGKWVAADHPDFREVQYRYPCPIQLLAC
jgi:hypothetical protein